MAGSARGGAKRDDTLDAFEEAVNMTPAELEKWLATDESRGVGQSSGGDESVGHASGRRIIDLLRTKKDDLSEDDVTHMRKVVGYVHRHAKQRPSGDVTETRWRHSLMNWRHDPLK
ncbi:DUF3140 domain-containing protein [Streptomyces sp. NPDC046977]|uniref:DUF3140 domain-containing protein n=1 Tax=Streptomyces sp. NPDC046977 TaxID=3154703 RepID=UPI0033F1BDA7